MKSFTIRRFSGIETKFDRLDQNRGTLRHAAGVLPVPVGSLSFGPVWGSVWGYSSFSGSVATALAGASSGKVHFVTVTRAGHTFLVAWEITANRPRGVWYVAGSGNPSFTLTSGKSITAPSSAAYRDKAAGLSWFGSWIGGLLFLGNGTDDNLVYEPATGALRLLGPSDEPSEADDRSRVRIPPCTTFAQTARGAIAAGGNSAAPRRVWVTEAPTARHPSVEGLPHAEAYCDIIAPSGSITAICSIYGRAFAYLSSGFVAAIETAVAGQPIAAVQSSHASPISPACVALVDQQAFYLGTDLEVYRMSPPAKDGAMDNRDAHLVSDRCSSQWHGELQMPISGHDYFTALDDRSGRLWIWGKRSGISSTALWCYDDRAHAVTGPWAYPDLLAATIIRSRDLQQTYVVGITATGSLVCADVSDIGEGRSGTLSYPATRNDLVFTGYGPLESAPSSGRYVVVAPDGLQFSQVNVDGTVATLFSPWDFGFSVHPLSIPEGAKYYANAQLSIVEFSTEDMGMPDGHKEFVQVRLHWRRRSAAFVGVYAECDGLLCGKWRGGSFVYPKEEQICGIGVSGRTLRLRIVAVTHNAIPPLLHGLTIDYLEGGKA